MRDSHLPSGPFLRDTENVTDCSAVKRTVIDYCDMRQRTGIAREKDRRVRLGRGRDCVICAGDPDVP